MDIHTKTAMELFKVEKPEDVTPAQRNYAKAWNYIELYSQNVPLPERTAHLIVCANNVNNVDLAAAEAMLAAYRARYGDVGLTLATLTKQYQAVSERADKARATLEEMLRKAPKELTVSKRDKVRVSAKNGATWPKPKGAY